MFFTVAVDDCKVLTLESLSKTFVLQKEWLFSEYYNMIIFVIIIMTNKNDYAFFLLKKKLNIFFLFIHIIAINNKSGLNYSC